ncbi:hypothetical protein MRI28_17490 [Nocardiopsis dassonvillei]|uniref:hypothetical protein n=1 Tax=Nocardiopsis dassonvillei TaxID=2014 RepID=UPI00201064CF|nr:hypothetical protein [Nocardiopsis dassonvillei]MCK9871410.1 hypothetical protein [Nocardiopsis dassonvillei]
MTDSHPEYDSYTEELRRAFLAAHPEGGLGPQNPDKPYTIDRIKGTDAQGRLERLTYVVYTAVARRNPEDSLPGVGTAWVPLPGPGSLRGKELQVAETIAWGRAIRSVMPGEASRPRSAQTAPWSDREVSAMRARVTRPPSLPFLEAAIAEVDEALALARISPETAQDLKSTAEKARGARFGSGPARTVSDSGTPAPATTSDKAEVPPPSDDAALSERARAIAANHAAPQGAAS